LPANTLKPGHHGDRPVARLRVPGRLKQAPSSPCHALSNRTHLEPVGQPYTL